MKSISALALLGAATGMANVPNQVDQFHLSDVSISRVTYKGVDAFDVSMPAASYQDPAKEA